MKIQIILLTYLLVLTSCNKPSKMMLADRSMNEVSCLSMSMSPPLKKESSSGYSPKLIKKGEITFSAIDVEKTKNDLYILVKNCNGHIINEELKANDPSSFYSISLNIPASNFEKFIASIDSKKFNIISKSFSTQDVTMEYVDNETRLENKRKLESRYLELLTKTKDIKDMLEIEEKLESIRSDIESRENQLKVMNQQIAYSEFTIQIQKQYSNITEQEKNKYSYKLKQGLINGWDGLKFFIVFIITIWPLLLISTGIIVFIKYLIKKLKKKRKE